MPWGPNNASRYSKLVKTQRQRERWASVANHVLETTGDEAQAIRVANATIRNEKTQRDLKHKSRIEGSTQRRFI